MTRRTLYTSRSGKGTMVAVDETPAERAARLEKAAERASRRFRLTDGQLAVLRRRGRSTSH